MARGAPITVYKCDHNGREVLHYEGVVLARDARCVQLEAVFSYARDVDLGVTRFERGDRFVEWFYSDRWYNIFEIHAAADDRLKGWYCNITRPAVLTAETVRADDLALDLWVAPDGAVTLLDEDEFAALTLVPADSVAVQDAVQMLRRAVRDRTPPFHLIAR